jgi:BirA family biotin operon repressor/biotin-[acetyl-CoA-carboxylase] ligase
MATPIGYNAHEQTLIAAALPESSGWRARFASVVPSTQDAVRMLVGEGEAEHIVVVASHQTDGRGRQGGRWHQEPGQDASFSVLLEPRGRYPDLLLPMLVATAVHQCVAGRLGETRHDVRIKWPNDVLVDGRKIAGILIEAEGKGLWIAGIGLNVNSTEFPEQIPRPPTSLTLLTDSYVERSEVVAELLRSIVTLVTEAEAGNARPAIDGFERGLGLIGEQVTVTTGTATHTGQLESVSPAGVIVSGRRFAPGEVRALATSA